MDAALRKLGDLPALPVVAAGYALTVLTVVVLSKSAATVVAIILTVVLIVYCYARPAVGWSVWSATVLPTAVGSIAAGFGARWVGLLLLPVMFIGLWSLDHDTWQHDGPRRKVKRKRKRGRSSVRTPGSG